MTATGGAGAFRARRCRRRRDKGAVTAEFAVALPALAMVLGFGLGGLGAVLDQLRCVDAAREAALVAARGGDGFAVAAADAPPGAAVTIADDGTLTRVIIRVRTRPLGHRLPGVPITVTATAADEPEVP